MTKTSNNWQIDTRTITNARPRRYHVTSHRPAESFLNLKMYDKLTEILSGDKWLKFTGQTLKDLISSGLSLAHPLLTTRSFHIFTNQFSGRDSGTPRPGSQPDVHVLWAGPQEARSHRCTVSSSYYSNTWWTVFYICAQSKQDWYIIKMFSNTSHFPNITLLVLVIWSGHKLLSKYIELVRKYYCKSNAIDAGH